MEMFVVLAVPAVKVGSFPDSGGLLGPDGPFVGKIRRVAGLEDAYVSYPQLVELDDDRYLLGWGVMHKLDGTDDDSDESFRVPWEYWVTEIDSRGNRYSEPQKRC